jgi:hypothetical protein
LPKSEISLAKQAFLFARAVAIPSAPVVKTANRRAQLGKAFLSKFVLNVARVAREVAQVTA